MSLSDWLTLIGLIGGGLAAIREFYFLPQKARQELLDKLPDPAPRPMPVHGEYSTRLDREYVMHNAIDFSTLEARLSSPKRHIYKSLEKLVKDRRIEIFILTGRNEGDHPNIPRGTVMKLPLVYKGLLPPHLRSPDKEVHELIAAMRRR